jgi:uncharacterized lipoprotein YddW (UPF0748 family)
MSNAFVRATWMQDRPGRDWQAIMANLSKHGFTKIFPCMSTGGTAMYESEVLPWTAPHREGEQGVTQPRDELSLCLEAAKDHGIEVHVWRINWAMWRAPKERLDEYVREGRVQLTHEGKPAPEAGQGCHWMCPSDERNRELEKRAMLEPITRYDADGIHFDYMRFPNRQFCFCPRCRALFEKQTGAANVNYPEDVLGTGWHDKGPWVLAWAEFRRGLISSLVREISEEARRLKPSVKVSLASWASTWGALRDVAQDWFQWVDEGWLDFICPMDYSPDVECVRRAVQQQVGFAGARAPVYAGLGAFLLPSPKELAAQIQAARSVGAGGFCTFTYDTPGFDGWLPELVRLI